MTEMNGLAGTDFWIRHDLAETGADCRIYLGGRFTFRALGAFRSVLDLVQKSGVKACVIDMVGVGFMDTAALWMLQVARSEAAGKDCVLTIDGAAGEVRNLLRLSGFEPEGGPGVIFGEALLHPSVVVDAGGDWPEGSRPLLSGEATAEVISSGLATPFFGFVEAGADPSPRCLMAVSAGGLALSVSTGAACSIEVVQPFAAAVGKALGDIDASMIELCLAEAVGNAAIHGNLGIDGALRSTREGFELFSRQMGERLADPVTAGKRIDVIMVPQGDDGYRLSVSDRGRGFDFVKAQEIVAGPSAKHGRGIALIRRIARDVFTEDGGRTLVMDFDI